MKKLAALLLLVIASISCSPLDDNAPQYYLDVLPVETFTVPESFDMNAVYEIKVTYKRPTNCHLYDGIYYEKSGDERTFGVQTRVFENENCQPIDEDPIEVKFDFQCTPGYKQYVFKFYKGEDEDGNTIFEEVVIPVTY